MTVLVVAGTFGVIAEDIKSFGRFLEALDGFVIARISIRVIFQGNLPVGLLDLVGRRVLLDAEDLLDIKHARTRKKR